MQGIQLYQLSWKSTTEKFNSKSKFNISLFILFSDFINQEIIEDTDDPREPGHFDYKYIKSKAGPLSNETDPLMEQRSSVASSKH